jgi:hypothetical protein
MPRSVGVVVENNFTGGLVTEATALNFPENAVTDIDNCVITKTGAVVRRGSLVSESGGKTNASALYSGDNAISTFSWRIAGGNGDLVLLVVQNGNVLSFYTTGPYAISQHKFLQEIDLNAFQASTVSTASFECQYAVGNGYLFVTNPNMQPVYISYDVGSSTFSASPIYMNVRDFTLLNDGLGVADRPADLGSVHHYALANNGWDDAKINKFKTDVGAYPSRADVFWILKDAYGNFAPGVIVYQKSVNDKVIDVPGELRANTVFRGNTPAPNGHFFCPPFTVDRSNLSGIPGLPSNITSARPSTVAFHSGRVFYSGVKSPGFTDKIYFSQTIETPAQFGQCMQVNDPTSENLFNLLATDGGVISIPEAGDIVKMFPMAAALIVFATNGIWAITGSTGIGFSATDYTVSKVSSINVKTATSFVDYEGNPVFWNEEGIFIGATSQTGGVEIQSITEKTIKQFYQSIPLASRASAKGAYNPLSKTIEWLYRSVPPINIAQNYDYDKTLIYSTQYQGFYKWSFQKAPNTLLNSIFVAYGVDKVGSPTSYKTKYLMMLSPSGVSIGEIDENSYQDFGINSYSSYFTTGYKLRGQAVKQGQTNYLYVYFTKQYGSKISVQALWDYATSGNTGRWSSHQVVESGRGDYSYDFRRLKIRGQGKAVQYKFSSVGDAPFSIPGWGAVDSTNAAT